MAQDEAPLSWQTVRSGGRRSLALILALAIVFGLLGIVYGSSTAESIILADMTDILWLLRSWELGFFLVFYQLGNRFDFRRQYAYLAALSMAGVLIGSLPELVSIQTVPGTSSASFSFAFQGVGLGGALAVFVGYLDNAFQDFAFPFAGLALAFVVRQASFRVPSGSRLLGVRALALAFAVTTVAFLASGVTYVIGSRLSSFSAFVVAAPYNSYAYDFFYPLVFFIAFYFVGKRLLDSQSGMVSFALCVFAAGVLGYLVGEPLAYYLRTFAAPGQLSPAFAFNVSFVETAVVRGGYVLTLGLAGAFLGFVRGMKRLAWP